jgi:hypothetical protein
MFFNSLASLLTLTCAANLASALDFYVSIDGSGPTGWGNGSIFTSLEAAQLAVRKELAKGSCEAVNVNVGDGTYVLTEPLNFTSKDSGCPGQPVTWRAAGSNATISGGIKVTGWNLNGTTGIYSAAVPKGVESRNLFVNGWASNYARRELNRTHLSFTNSSIQWNASDYDWLMSTPGIAEAEVRSINSFTDRYAPIQAVGQRELIMLNNSWQNQIIGYDDFSSPFADFGLWVQNALALLHEGGQYYLDSPGGTVYYMPLEGEDMSTAETYLGSLEALLVLGGTYDQPIHDVSFEGLNFVRSMQPQLKYN